MTPHATSQSDYELRLPQERVKYAMLGGSEVVVGTSSVTSYDLGCTRIMVLAWRPADALDHAPSNPHTSPILVVIRRTSET